MKTIKLDKKDYSRALLTDTYPADVPIIFSNDGLYINGHLVKKGSSDVKTEVVTYIYKSLIRPELDGNLNPESKKQSQHKQTTPFKYKIIKNDISLRTLSLIHPRSQMNYLEIYRENTDLLLSLCEKSNFSIRSPMRVCNSFYLNVNGANFKDNSYKKINIETIEEELFKKHASSYYSYKGFDRIHKLYSSPLYKDLEAQYPFMLFLDVANCFDSIYTHTVSWAAKNKSYIKDHYVKWTNQFSHNFDSIIQRSNANETNGIPVGSEFSRIFAEVIFQDVDVNIERVLCKEYNLQHKIDYQILRYVDDYMIFGMTDDICDTVSNVVSDCLSEYNLFINTEKTIKLERPFCTNKSKVIISLSSCLDYFETAIFNKEKLKERKYFQSRIYKKHNFMTKFMNEVRLVALSSSKNGYFDVSSYLVSFFSKRITSSIEDYEEYIENEGSKDVFFDNIELMIELMFFYYKVHPTINSSNKMAKVIVSILEFMTPNADLSGYLSRIKNLVVSSIKEFSFDRNKDEKRKGYISIERLNVIISTSDFGCHFRLPESYFENLVSNSKELNYFEIISLLYYFKDHAEYHNVKKKVITSAMDRLTSYSLIENDSELLHLLLDMSCCPYVSFGDRVKILEIIYSKSKPQSPSPQQLNSFVNSIRDVYWFVNWKKMNIKKLIERNELKLQY